MTNYNSEMAAAAVAILPTGETIGSPKWVQCGMPLTPSNTGDWGGGWNHNHLVDGNEALILSNAMARPRFYLDEGCKRLPGYFNGERPWGWTWKMNGIDTPDGGQRVGGQTVYGLDSEHFLSGPLFALAARDKAPLIEFPWGSVPANHAARDICWFIQRSALGMCRPGMWYPGTEKNSFIGNRPSDRTIARLLFALLVTGQMYEYTGQDLADVKAAVELFLSFQEQGPMILTKTQEADPPIPEGTPYWMFVQYVGYGLPVWSWVLDTLLPWLPQDRILALCGKMIHLLDRYVGEDGSTPWSITTDGVPHYYTSRNGDRWSAGYEMFAACQFTLNRKLADAILARHKALTNPADILRERAWLVDANGIPVKP